MPVVYGSPDLLPTLSVVYVCRCGRRAGEYGGHAGEPPPNWLQLEEGEYLCEHCASLAADAGSEKGRRQAP